ncbi:hypothetical protein [Primorskyibacter sp. S187A]|uniref:hypothetical protein n=1 Tax=Primorskyibacter sp. S187A TaxID=3415130 RepID=UPI003C7CF73D
MRRGLSACLASALLAGFVAGPLAAQTSPVVPENYDTLARELPGLVSFDTLPPVPEPGHLIDGLYRAPGALIGERFMGQTLLTARDAQNNRFDAFGGDVSTPLQPVPGGPGQSLAIAQHRGFGSMAAFPLGPRGYPDVAALGEGALAVLFEADQAALGLRLHAEYEDPLGARPLPGIATLTFYDRSGQVIGVQIIGLHYGPQDIGVRFPDKNCAAFTLTTKDPGGIAVDDILYSLAYASS